MDKASVAGQLGALAHPVRLGILMHIARNGECGCRDVVETLPLAQSTVSQHLKVLSEAGLISLERRAQRSHYRLDRDALRRVSQELSAIVEECCSPECCGPDRCTPNDS